MKNEQILLNKLAQATHEMDNVSKPLMCFKLDALIESNPTLVKSMLNSDFHITRDFIQSLYKHFQPIIPKIPKMYLQVLNKCTANDDIRKFLNYIYCDGTHLISADGYRLVRVKNVDNLPNGFYDSKLNRVELNKTYPDTSFFFEQIRANKFTSTPDCVEYIHVSGKKEHVKFTIDKQGNKLGFQLKYIIAMGHKPEDMTFKYKDMNSGMLIDLPEFQGEYVIMPIRI